MSDTKIKTRITLAVNETLLNHARDEDFDCPTVKEAFHNASFLGHLFDSEDVDTILIKFESDVPESDMMLEEELELAIDKVNFEFGSLPGTKTFAIMIESHTPSGWDKSRYCGAAEEFNFDQACYDPLNPKKIPLSERESFLVHSAIQQRQHLKITLDGVTKCSF